METRVWSFEWFAFWLCFSCEKESDGTLLFLDIIIQRQDSTFVRFVHWKSMYIGLYVRWDSFYPKLYKINLEDFSPLSFVDLLYKEINSSNWKPLKKICG